VNSSPGAIDQGGASMRRFITRKWFALILGIIVFSAASRVSAGDPSDEMRATIENVLATLKDPHLKGSQKQEERRTKLKSVVYPRFDFAEMGKRSLGSHWQKRSPQEQKQFIELFSELVEASYIDAIESYNGEKVVVGNERQDNEFAEVSTKILTKKGEEFAVDYRLRQAGRAWKVYDVVLENVSLVNNYRSQFNRVIAKSSYDELLNKMKQKQFDAPGKKLKT
jgi:phospholipid transport system substrate-binding protein